ncbi:sterile alpha motif domain-containing protein 9-like [Mantella aurantiaca]
MSLGDKPPGCWTESDVSDWLASIGLEEKYITKLQEELTGPVLKILSQHDLKKFGIKDFQMQLILRNRDKVLAQIVEKEIQGKSPKQKGEPHQEPGEDEKNTGTNISEDEPKDIQCNPTKNKEEKNIQPRIVQKNTTTREKPGDTDKPGQKNPKKNSNTPHDSTNQKQEDRQHLESADHSKLPGNPQQTLGIFRPFDKHDQHFKYVKNHVLSPESGVIDLITPCHEYKSFAIAATLDRPRLQAKLRFETYRFAAACLNVRTNGTIHFGIMDSVEDKGFTHGQIVGIPIKDKDWYADVLNDLDTCFPESKEKTAARLCVRSPVFIEVVDAESEEKRYVVEVDIVPWSGTVKGISFQVKLPKFHDEKNKTMYENKVIYERKGTSSQSIIENDINALNLRLKSADKRRKEAEEADALQAHRYENLGRKLSVLLTNGKQNFDDTLQYVLITNRCENGQLQHLNFLERLKILCIFDFDAESDESGLHSKCKKYHLTRSYSLNSFASECGEIKLGFFKQTSWIFCNGWKNCLGDLPCDELSWIKGKMKHFKKAVSLICDNIRKGSFIVLFMLFSPVEKPIVKAFNEFYEELNGMEYITCITECEEYYEQWAGLAQATCSRTELDQRSIVGMKLSHVDATVQNMIPGKDFNRKLPVSTKGMCVLTIPQEEKMNSINILCINECENLNLMTRDPRELERDFYRGGKISWKHLWLAEQKKCGAFIERYACQEVDSMLNGILNEDTVKTVARINIYHQPGSGGSTVARQILWKNKKNLRCAIVNSRYQTAKVCEHAVQLREYDERDTKNCLPVLLLLEDCPEEYIADLKNSLQEAMTHKKVRRAKTCFILLTCKRSHAPEQYCSVSSSDTVAITHKLKADEKLLFKGKAEELNDCFPSQELIITFVLMSQEFKEKYLEDFVRNVMNDLDHSSPVTRLIRYVALLNLYVQDSYISLSHCEVLLGIQSSATEKFKRRQNDDLNSLSEKAWIIKIKTELIPAIRILHPLIAGEILNQYSTRSYPQSKIAMELLNETAALSHRFAQQEFVTFIKRLFLNKSRGDHVDSFSSPLIEHVFYVEKQPEMAIQLLHVAYEQFKEDAHFAQQLTRLHYKNHKFEEAKKWVETAKAKLPGDSYISDTEGRLYKEWFTVNYDKYKRNPRSVDEIGLIERGLQSMECFRSAQRAANNERDAVNKSGYFGEVDMGCSLLELLIKLFKNINKDKVKLVKYLINENYIPGKLKDSWAKLHARLKSLYQNMYDALAWISEDVLHVQDNNIDIWDSTKIKSHPDSYWLIKQTKKFAKYFCTVDPERASAAAKKNPFARKMAIYRLGGGSVATILLLLYNSQDQHTVSALKRIISYFPRDISEDTLDDDEIISLIMCQFALRSVKPQSKKLFKFRKLLDISQRLLNQRKTFPASAYFLLFMLYWPDEKFLTAQYEHKGNILEFVMEKAIQLQKIKVKDVLVHKKRTDVHFFLGKGAGLQKFIFRGDIEKLLNHPLNERTFHSDSDIRDRKLIQDKLKEVDGWTEYGRVYTKGAFGEGKIEVLPLDNSLDSYGNKNVTFYLGFTCIGYVTFGIKDK